jgi:uncharacterized protein with HEPN domain
MPRRDIRMYLRDVVEACDALRSHVAGCDEARFRSERLVRAATEREFTIICEAVAQILRQDPSLETRITDSKGIAHFRNIIIHAYDLVDPATMWQIVQQDVGVLRDEAAALLAERESGSSS